MFYMYMKIAQYLRLVFESNLDQTWDIFSEGNLVQLITLLAYFPEKHADRSENFWQMKINLAHLINHSLLQQSPSLHQAINNTIVQHAPELFSKTFFITRFSLTSSVLPRYSHLTITDDHQWFN